jgi:tRNA(Arg) A34 adenosine deaminase TadA
MMRHALVIARQNPEYPFGCVIVDERGDIVAEGLHQGRENSILRGEIDAINECAKTCRDSDWSRLTLYTTAEPGPLCMSAIVWSGIGHVVFGTSLETLMKLGWPQIDIPSSEVVARSWNQELSITGGVLEEQCNQLFQMRDETSRDSESG